MVCGLLLALGAWSFRQLPVEAYPNIAPLNVQVITQWSGRSTLEIERQLTIPIETALAGAPDAQSVRSVSLFGLSVVTIQFREGTEPFHARQNVALYLNQLNFPAGVQPTLGPDADATGEIMRYRLAAAPGTDLTGLKGLQDWVVFKELKSVPGVADVNGFGGMVKQYQVLPDPRRLQFYNVTLAQLAQALGSGNANVGGGLLHAGEQQLVVRGVGLVESLRDIGDIVVAESGGVPVRVADLAAVQAGHAERLGQVQFDGDDDTVEGIVVMRRGENATEVLGRVRSRVAALNASGRLPPGVQVAPYYDRQELLDLTVHTVGHTLLVGIGLVLAVLWIFLGNLRVALTVAAIIPLGLCVSFVGMHWEQVPANLISLGAIDFGLIVNAAVIVIENIMQHLERRRLRPLQVFRTATAEVQRAMIFSTAIIIVAYAPLFLMGGVEGKIFEPMAFTMGLALLASIALSTTFIPAAASTLFGRGLVVRSPHFIDWMQQRYRGVLQVLVHYPLRTGAAALACLGLAAAALVSLGTSFLPTLEENNLWIRVTLPNTVDLAYAGSVAARIRAQILRQPEVRDVAVQIGRPDDGTDSTGVFNQEFGVYLKSPREFGRTIDRQDVIERLQAYFAGIPGIDVNFSQYIQDNVDEALSGVKGENSVKLFGDDLDVLQAKAQQIQAELEQVPGIADAGIFKELGQPTLNLSVDRARAARYGLNVADVENVVLNAVGGNPQSQVLEGERVYDLVLRLPETVRADADAIGRLLVDTPDAGRIPLAMVAQVRLADGPFFVYRESARRYIAVKFGVRGRDLGGAVAEAQARIAARVPLPRGYLIHWDGQFNEMKVAQRKLVVIIPVALVAIFVLLVLAFNRARDAALVLINVPYAAIGGIGALYLAHEDLSISAGIGFLSLFGIAIQNLVILIASIRELAQHPDWSLLDAVVEGATRRFRSVLMTALLAALGLAPAAFSHAIGSQAQRPLALVIFGGMLSTTLLTLLLLPVAFARVNRLGPPPPGAPPPAPPLPGARA
ncbi:MAG: efflux RND transporter permease subunit [Nevskia sp.]|nr:efflux RND transporter permease subunit [Nevskia sp.]